MQLRPEIDPKNRHNTIGRVHIAVTILRYILPSSEAAGGL